MMKSCIIYVFILFYSGRRRLSPGEYVQISRCLSAFCQGYGLGHRFIETLPYIYHTSSVFPCFSVAWLWGPNARKEKAQASAARYKEFASERRSQLRAGGENVADGENDDSVYGNQRSAQGGYPVYIPEIGLNVLLSHVGKMSIWGLVHMWCSETISSTKGCYLLS